MGLCLRVVGHGGQRAEAVCSPGDGLACCRLVSAHTLWLSGAWRGPCLLLLASVRSPWWPHPGNHMSLRNLYCTVTTWQMILSLALLGCLLLSRAGQCGPQGTAPLMLP